MRYRSSPLHKYPSDLELVDEVFEPAESVRTSAAPVRSVDVVFLVTLLKTLGALLLLVTELIDREVAIMLAMTLSVMSLGEVGVDTPDSGLANSSAYIFSVSVKGWPEGVSLQVAANRR